MTKTMQHAHEVAEGERFAFGANWWRFLKVLNDARIAQAEQSLRDMLGVRDLQGKRFLDIGSGSGLFSLAARRLGATVHAFDYDPQSVACTRELKRRYAPEDPHWSIEEGSVLDRAYLARLGQFDVVYSWGVLHHTGAMWDALDNVAALVAEGGNCASRFITTRDGSAAIGMLSSAPMRIRPWCDGHSCSCMRLISLACAGVCGH